MYKIFGFYKFKKLNDLKAIKKKIRKLIQSRRRKRIYNYFFRRFKWLNCFQVESARKNKDEDKKYIWHKKFR